MSIELKTDSIKSEFQAHLNLEANTRIIFSGAFGTGKTTFLKQFFEKKQDAKYLGLHLFPVNYSVASNEDIFELIKVDLLYSLLDHSPNLDKLSISNWDALLLGDAKDQYVIFKGLINLFGKIGKSVEPILKGLESLLLSLKTAIENSKKRIEKDEGKTIQEFFMAIEATSGNIYERNVITELIAQIVQKLKAEQQKEIVLIIDDLDRIDPEHIFRLLNVFGAHFDTHSGENKFGIDKVIFCCDIQNIRTIFQHKYGVLVDFNGYIDKFYTRGVFNYDIRAILVSDLQKILTAVKPRTNEDYDIFSSNFTSHRLLVYVLLKLIKAQTINLRSVLKFVNKSYSKKREALRFDNNDYVSSESLYVLPTLHHLIDLFGDRENLITALAKTPIIFTQINDERMSFLICVLTIADINGHCFKLNIERKFDDFKYVTDNSRFKLTPTHYRNQALTEAELESPIDFSQLLIAAINSLKQSTSR